MNASPKIYGGTDDFKDLLYNSTLFVDKSLFINEFLGLPYKVSLIMRPRRWGKSLNMSMLEYFLKMELDKDGNLLPEQEKENNKLFLGGEIILDSETNESRQLLPLKIAQHTNIVKKYQGRYPVISISFKEVRGNSYEAIEEKMSVEIAKLFRQHKYLLRHTENADKIKFSSFLNEESDYTNICYSLYFLSRLLHEYHGKKVFILIDEYDATINEAYIKLKEKDPDSFEKVLDMFRSMLGASLKTNEHLERGLLTGILRIAKAGLLSGLNNLGEYSLLDSEFNDSYGFTEQEVDELLNIVPVQTSREKIKSWYNGYTFENQLLYNPWSIMNCLAKKGKLDHYWLDSGGTSLIDSALVTDEIQEDLRTLLSGSSITTPIIKQVSFGDLSSPEGLYSLLLFAGYLNTYSVLNPEKDLYKLNIPNYEVKKIYEERLIEWLAKKLNTSGRKYNNVILLLTEGNIGLFKGKLQELLTNTTSFYQLGKRVAEMFYTGFMLGIVSCLETDYHIDSERETGNGRADLLLIPKSDSNHHQALVLEYKVAKDINALAQTAIDGLIQINEKGYDTKVKVHSNVTSILKICMAFYDNNIEIEYQVDSINSGKN